MIWPDAAQAEVDKAPFAHRDFALSPCIVTEIIFPSRPRPRRVAALL